MRRCGSDGYEVEHIWADPSERHTDEFGHSSDFAEYRNRSGGLLLLPKRFHASYGDQPFSDKRKDYLKHNLLSQSLHEDAHERNPGLSPLVRISAVPFTSYIDHRRTDLDDRQDLYRCLAEHLWVPEKLAWEAEA